MMKEGIDFEEIVERVTIDLTEKWDIRNGPKVQVKNPAFFSDMQKCIRHFEVECKFDEMGIMCLRPPEEMIPELFDFRKGPKGWGQLKNKVSIVSFSEQIITRPNMEKAPHLTVTRHVMHNKTRSFAEFMDLAKLQRRYNPLSTDSLSEAERLFWTSIANVGCEGTHQNAEGAYYAFTIDGSLMKTLEGKERVRETCVVPGDV